MIRLAVRCAPAAAEPVLAELLVLAPGGVEQEEGPGWVEYAIYGAPGELPDLGTVRALSGDEPIEVRSQEIPDDWADRWRDFHEAILIGGRVLVRPSWLGAPEGEARARQDRGTPGSEARPRHGRDAPGSEAEEVSRVHHVIVDPGQAFGTGAHPTTRMCIELLVDLADEGLATGALADLGTGSGVLAITAAKLGWDPVTALDSEQAAVDATAENAGANGVAIEARRLNLREDEPPPAPTLVANLTAPLLRGVAAAIGRADPPRALVCSGLLTSEADEVAAAFAGAGLAETIRRSSGDWAALRLGAP